MNGPIHSAKQLTSKDYHTKLALTREESRGDLVMRRLDEGFCTLRREWLERINGIEK